MANLCIKTPSSAILVLIFQLLVLRPRPIVDVVMCVGASIRNHGGCGVAWAGID